MGRFNTKKEIEYFVDRYLKWLLKGREKAL